MGRKPEYPGAGRTTQTQGEHANPTQKDPRQMVELNSGVLWGNGANHRATVLHDFHILNVRIVKHGTVYSQ